MSDQLTYTIERQWEHSAELSNRFDLFVTVEGHPDYDAIRVYLFPHGARFQNTPGFTMEWVRDGSHFGNEEAPIPDDVRAKVEGLIVRDLKRRLLQPFRP